MLLILIAGEDYVLLGTRSGDYLAAKPDETGAVGPVTCGDTMPTETMFKEAKYVDTPQGLTEMRYAIEGHAVVAIDTEFIREKTYYPQLCLIQIAAGNSIWCIDTLAIDDLTSFFQDLSSSSVLKIFHAARQDLEIFFIETAQIPTPLFDTQIAAALLGRPDQIAYAGLVSEFYKIDLDKGPSRTNWMQRPLTESQLDYAADDVRYLHGIKDKLTEELGARGRLEWLNEECGRLAEIDLYENDPATVWRRVKGIAKLEPHQRNIARALAAWRENIARERDLPRGWVLKDDRLIALARAAPTSSAELYAVEGLAPGLLRRHGIELLDAIRTPMTNSCETHAVYSPRLTASGKQLLQDLLVALRNCAEDNSVSGSLIATRNDLESAICGRTDIRLYEGWRNTLFGDAVRNQVAAATAKLYE